MRWAREEEITFSRSPSSTLPSRLDMARVLQSLRSGWVEDQKTGLSESLGRSQVHLARPVVPGGQGWIAVSPAAVQFQDNDLAVDGGQWRGWSSTGMSTIATFTSGGGG